MSMVEIELERIQRLGRLLQASGVSMGEMYGHLSHPRLVRPVLSGMLGRSVGENEARTWKRRARRLVRECPSAGEQAKVCVLLATPGGEDPFPAGPDERVVLDASAASALRVRVVEGVLEVPLSCALVPCDVAEEGVAAYQAAWCKGWSTRGPASAWVLEPGDGLLQLEEQALGCLQEAVQLARTCVVRTGSGARAADLLIRRLFDVRMQLREEAVPGSGEEYRQRLAGLYAVPRPADAPLH